MPTDGLINGRYREARATARLSHPGVVTVFDVLEHDDAPVIVMELIEGETLAEILRQRVRLPWRRVAEIGAAMVDALREAHAAGIVHRDLKPANVLVVGRRIVITDFGIAQRSGERTAAVRRSGLCRTTPDRPRNSPARARSRSGTSPPACGSRPTTSRSPRTTA
jgi:serine/threonine protein kinase